ncbi:unnamed protein product [Adineta steineri]|uniref:G-protein coupled receptors family 1 profile domain-containing protein n=1 Tax=Adineta steineri TaxID=433720 RepID=A0A819W6Y2_9BILA|nr:unnamed protein product [Adineta steineri]CAF4120103.1 unnamed protein product [Adineta steineri]
MNSSTHRLANIIIDCSIITLTSISICISTGIFSFIIYHVIKFKNSPHRVALLLTANIYFAILFSCVLLLKEYIHVLSGHVYSMNSFNNGIYCQLRAYFLWSSNCTIYYSNTLQSIYRLCRVIFYRKQSLQSFQLYQILILIQWILCFLVMIPGLLLGNFKYLKDDYLCQIDYTSLQDICMNGILAYAIPLYTTIGCYLYTLRKMRRGNNRLILTMTQIQQISARRDLIVLSRICTLLGLLLTISIPAMIAYFIYLSSGYLPWWLSQSQWLAFSLITCIVTIVLLIISPHVRKLWTKKFRPRNIVIPMINKIH